MLKKSESYWGCFQKLCGDISRYLSKITVCYELFFGPIGTVGCTSVLKSVIVYPDEIFVWKSVRISPCSLKDMQLQTHSCYFEPNSILFLLVPHRGRLSCSPDFSQVAFVNRAVPGTGLAVKARWKLPWRGKRSSFYEGVVLSTLPTSPLMWRRRHLLLPCGSPYPRANKRLTPSHT